jgi:hypothetical protein
MRLFDGNYPVVVKDQPMDQVNLVRSLREALRYSNSDLLSGVALGEKLVTKETINSPDFVKLSRSRDAVFRDFDLGDSAKREE